MILRKNPITQQEGSDMAREIKDAAVLTVQIVIESPDEVIMVREAPIVEFPNKKAHEVVSLVQGMSEHIEEDFYDFINYANGRLSDWIDAR